MTISRSQQISLNATPYYHCVSRCVRRAFLCGDAYEHRRGWVESRLLELGGIFCIDIAAYAVMSNHYHVVLYINTEESDALNNDHVIDRWHKVFKGNALSQRYCAGETLSVAERKVLNDVVDIWRQRLTDISWFMRIMNEGIARQANAEDKCTGRFWEGRFKSQALLDEKALLACMAYVDLNPIRAKMAKTLENSDYTSIKKRANKAKQAYSPNHPKQQIQSLLAFTGNPRKDMPVGIACTLTDYLALVDWTGRIMRKDKRGIIEADLPPILDRLSIASEQWLEMTEHFESRFKGLIGTSNSMQVACEKLFYQRIPNITICKKLLN